MYLSSRIFRSSGKSAEGCGRTVVPLEKLLMLFRSDSTGIDSVLLRAVRKGLPVSTRRCHFSQSVTVTRESDEELKSA